MRFDPLREFDRLAGQALAGARTARTIPAESKPPQTVDA
jgi:hypothetical protein